MAHTIFILIGIIGVAIIKNWDEIEEFLGGCVVIVFVLALGAGVIGLGYWGITSAIDAYDEHQYKKMEREAEEKAWREERRKEEEKEAAERRAENARKAEIERLRREEEAKKAAEERRIAEENARKMAEENKRIATEKANRARRLEIAEKVDSEILRFVKQHSEKVSAMIESLNNSIIKSENYANDTKKRLEIVGTTNYQDDPRFKHWQLVKEEAKKVLLAMIADIEKIWCEEPLRPQKYIKNTFLEIEKKYDEDVKLIEQKF